MLRRQLQEWAQYPPSLPSSWSMTGAPPRLTVVEQYALAARARLRVYRILEDIPWNREEARNLGAQEAQTPWILMTDLDHILPVASAEALLQYFRRRRALFTDSLATAWGPPMRPGARMRCQMTAPLGRIQATRGQLSH